MQKLFSVVSILVLAGCATPKKEASSVNAAFVGTYRAENVIDTVEELALHSDGRFTFHFWLVGNKDEWFEGRWEMRDGRVILWALDKEGKQAAFPLEIQRQKEDLALIYPVDSSSHAKAMMLLPNTYRRTSPRTPNQMIHPTPGGVADR